MTTWRQALTEAMKEAGDVSCVVAVAPSEEAFAVDFDDDYGSMPKGPSVLAWTERRVYFPVVYDGSEWLASAPRDPERRGQEHVGRW